MIELYRNVRYGLRSLRRRPGFSLAVILTLGLGIGFAVTIFSVAYNVSLAPLPFDHADRLMWIYGSSPQGEQEGISPNDFRDYRRSSKSWETLAAATNFAPLYNLTDREEPLQIEGRGISAGFFEALGIHPLLGREFTEEDESASNPKVAILSYHMWQQTLGADPDVLGRTIELNDTPYTVVGVVPRFMNFLGDTDVWEPQRSSAPQLRAIRYLVMFGRLAPGVTLEQAQEEMDSLATHLEAEFPDSNKDWRTSLTTLSNYILGPTRPTLLLLLGAVGFVLLIAVANVASLMLVRASRSAEDTAVRMALGASKRRVAIQYLTESVLLALISGALGCGLAFLGTNVFKALAPRDLPRLQDIGLDAPMLAIALLISLVTGLLFGSLPALRAWKPNLARSLQQGRRTSRGSGRLGMLLIVAEVALSLVLLVGAALLFHSLIKLQQVQPGFRTEGILATRVVLPVAKYGPTDSRARFWRALTEQLETIPGVETAAATTELPLTGQDNPTNFTATTPEGETYVVNLRSVTPDYLPLMDIPLSSGRMISPEDRAGTTPVVVINERMERELYRGEGAVGKHLGFDFGAGPYDAEIVGVVGNIHHESLAAEPFRETYFPAAQTPLLTYNVLVSTSLDDATVLAPAVRAAVREIDPAQSVGPFSTMEDLVGEELRSPRFRTSLLAVFSLLALILAGVGLYAVLSYAVSQQTREIGIRLACGADRGTIVKMVMWRGVALTLWGLGLGVAGAYFLARLASSLLYEVNSLDPLSFIAAALALVLVALLASYFPSRRAARLDPIRALNTE